MNNMQTIGTVAVFIGVLSAIIYGIYILAEADRQTYKYKETYFEECVEKTKDYKWCNTKINNPYSNLDK